MKHRKLYKTFTKEFKQEAVRLMEAPDRPASEIAMELGIRRNQLYKWKEQLSMKGEEVAASEAHSFLIGLLDNRECNYDNLLPWIKRSIVKL